MPRQWKEDMFGHHGNEEEEEGGGGGGGDSRPGQREPLQQSPQQDDGSGGSSSGLSHRISTAFGGTTESKATTKLTTIGEDDGVDGGESVWPPLLRIV